MVVLDDLHWAEPTLLDLVEHIADWSRDAPLLLCCLARPELLDARPSWGGGKRNAASIFLEPLGPTESERLVDHLLGQAALSETARLRIVDTAEGNPLFVEELLGMLIDDGLLTRADGHWAPTTTWPPCPCQPASLPCWRLGWSSSTARSAWFWARPAWSARSSTHRGGCAGARRRPVGDRPLPDKAGPETWSAPAARTSPGRTPSASATCSSAMPPTRPCLKAVGPSCTSASQVGWSVSPPSGWASTRSCWPTTSGRPMAAGPGGPVDTHGHQSRMAAERLAEAGRRALARGDMPAAAKVLERAAALPVDARAGQSCWVRPPRRALLETGALERGEATLTEAAATVEAEAILCAPGASPWNVPCAGPARTRAPHH